MYYVYRTSPKSGDASVVRLFEAMEVVLDQERFLIQATRLPWFKRTPEELEMAVGAAHSKVGQDLYRAYRNDMTLLGNIINVGINRIVQLGLGIGRFHHTIGAIMSR